VGCTDTPFFSAPVYLNLKNEQHVQVLQAVRTFFLSHNPSLVLSCFTSSSQFILQAYTPITVLLCVVVAFFSYQGIKSYIQAWLWGRHGFVRREVTKTFLKIGTTIDNF
jgi:hypothetical protein